MARGIKDPGDNLTHMQRRFIDEYLLDLNTTQAAIRAGANPNRAYGTASEWLRNPVIRQAVKDGLNKRQKRKEITRELVLEQLANIAGMNIKDFFDIDENGKQVLKPIDLLEDHVSYCIAGFTESGQYRFESKTKAIELLCKALDIFGDKDSIPSTTGITPLLNAIMQASPQVWGDKEKSSEV